MTAAGDQMARLWDVKSGELLGSFKGHLCSLKSVAFTPQEKGKLYTDQILYRWRPRCWHHPTLVFPGGCWSFFIAKNDKSIRPRIDFLELNNIVKNEYPLPLISSAFEALQGATIFSKLYLRNGLTNAPLIFQALVG